MEDQIVFLRDWCDVHRINILIPSILDQIQQYSKNQLSPLSWDGHDVIKLAMYNPVVVQKLHYAQYTNPFPL